MPDSPGAKKRDGREKNGWRVLPRRCSGQELCGLSLHVPPRTLNFDVNLTSRYVFNPSFISASLTFKNSLLRQIKKLNSLFRNTTFTAVNFNSCGHVENMCDTFLLKKGYVCSYILAGSKRIITKIMERCKHLPRSNHGRIRDTLRSGCVSTTKPGTLLGSCLMICPFSSTSTFPSGLHTYIKVTFIQTSGSPGHPGAGGLQSPPPLCQSAGQSHPKI